MKTLHANYTTPSVVPEILRTVRISDIWRELGGPPLRSGRGVAFWRDGDGFNVALDEDLGTWYDHARGEGGGILDLAQAILKLDRKDAVRWLADFAGVPLEQPRLTSEDRRRITAARVEGDAFYFWIKDQIGAFRYYRDMLMKTYSDALRVLRSYDPNEYEVCGAFRYDAAWAVYESYWDRIEKLDVRIDFLTNTRNFPELLDVYRRARRAAA